MSKPYTEMTPAERLQYRIQTNREIDQKVEYLLEKRAKENRKKRSESRRAKMNDDQITEAINGFRVAVGMSPLVTFRTNRGIFS